MNDHWEFGLIETSDIVQEGSKADALVVLSVQGDVQPHDWLPPGLQGTIAALANRGMFAGEQEQAVVLPTHGMLANPHLIMLGLGEAPLSLQNFRLAGAKLSRTLREWKIESAVIVIDGFIGSETHSLYAMTEGMMLGLYRAKSYGSDHSAPPAECRIRFATATGRLPNIDLLRQIELAQIFADATNYARDLTNLPGNLLTPAELANEALKLANRFGLQCSVLDEQDIAEQGMGGLRAVGQGSENPPRMIVLKYQGLEQWEHVTGLVGKGITFDTGGISLKKAEGMEEMISDMGGAAALFGVMQAVGRLKPKLNLLAVIPAAENMPSGSAYKPGDIIRTLSGKTVEVLNTDAEGRIVLADGMTYAKRLGAQRLIEVSTLTGAILVCLGDVATGAVTNHDAFYEELVAASRQSGEKLWQLPAFQEYWDMLKSDVADIKNATSPNRWAAAITAGLFIGTFAENTPWIHLDIGGTSWFWRERGADPKGGTGVMVRTLLHLLCKPGIADPNVNQ